jgi:hypothetical protein
VGCCLAQQKGSAQREAVDTVNRYVRLRLASAHWAAFSNLIAWEDEPGWDCNWVSDGYAIGSPESTIGAVIIPVKYRRLGLYCHDFAFKLDKRIVTTRYELVKSSGTWKIKAPEPEYPDVSASVLIRLIQIAARNPDETSKHRQQARAVARHLSELIRLKK